MKADIRTGIENGRYFAHTFDEEGVEDSIAYGDTEAEALRNLKEIITKKVKDLIAFQAKLAEGLRSNS